MGLARGSFFAVVAWLQLNHGWVADAWPSSRGVFSNENPDLGGQIGDIDAAPTDASRKTTAKYFTKN